MISSTRLKGIQRRVVVCKGQCLEQSKIEDDLMTDDQAEAKAKYSSILRCLDMSVDLVLAACMYNICSSILGLEYRFSVHNVKSSLLFLLQTSCSMVSSVL